jgi:putative ATP-binding cassette transporter
MTLGTSSEQPVPRKRPLRDFWRLAGPYWNCERRAKARGATLLLFMLTVAQVGLAIWGNYWNRALFDALEQRTAHGVLVQVGVFGVIFALSIVVTAAHLVVKRWLQLDWRAWLTERLVGEWLGDGRHYRLQFARGEHDNPDQRIAEDVRIATEVAVALAHSLVFSLMILVTFVDILWSVSGSIVVPGTGVEVPGYMVPLAFVYAAVGSVLGWMVGRPLVRTTNALQSAEATFRFGLSHAREHTESIALLHGESRERAGSAARFSEIVRDWDRQSLAYMGLVAFGTAYGALLPVFPILVAAPQYIAGAMSLGVLMQAAQAFQNLTSALSWPVNNVGEIARCRASADRVLALHEDLERLDRESPQAPGPRITLDHSGRDHLLIEGLCLAEPTGRVLLERFDARIRRGERVLIKGDSAVTGGLFKALAGLWPWGSGRIALPDDGEVQLVPQRPFLPQGTLREAICYPRPAAAFPQSEVLGALECTGLAWLAGRLDETVAWEQALPLHAQQRLAFARVLLHRPAWVIMEEVTDGFDGRSERLMLETLHRELPNSTLLAFRYRDGRDSLYQREIVVH